MKKKRHEQEGNNERWLITYSDLITLLLVFFIILYAFSKVDNKKYENLASGFNSVFGSGTGILTGGNSINIVGGTSSQNSSGEEKSEEDMLSDLKQQVDGYLTSNSLNESVSTDIDDRGLVISMSNSILFDSGTATIKSDNNLNLKTMGKLLNSMPNYIRIEGHTDNLPINNTKFKSNWELSVIRATNVAEILIDETGISPERISVLGYGEFRPIGDNSTAEGRAKNRRVDIIIMDTKFDKIEENQK